MFASRVAFIARSVSEGISSSLLALANATGYKGSVAVKRAKVCMLLNALQVDDCLLPTRE